MAKYSTGSGGSDAGGSCELCGADDRDLRTADVAGATLQVCSDCAKNHGETSGPGGDSGGRDEQDRNRKAAQNTAKIHDAGKADSSRWESGADYDSDQLPYLVPDYGSRVTEARQERGLQTGDLAEELDLEEDEVLAVEQGRATQANVAGSTITLLEDFLDVDLVDSR